MTIMEGNQEEMDENVINLNEQRIIKTKPAGDGGGGTNWLTPMARGTKFLGIFKIDLQTGKPFLVLFTVLDHTPKSTLLDMEGMGMDSAIYVNPITFCNVVYKHEVIFEPEKEEQ